MSKITIKVVEGENDLLEFSKNWNNISNSFKEEILGRESEFNGGSPNGRSSLHNRFSHYDFNVD